MPPSAINTIKQALSDLERERSRLQVEEAILRRTLQQLEGGEAPRPGGSESPLVPPDQVSPRPVRDIVLDIAPSDGSPFSLKDAVAAVNAEGNNSMPASISSILSRMAKDGTIEKGPRRGTYRLRAHRPPVEQDTAEVREQTSTGGRSPSYDAFRMEDGND